MVYSEKMALEIGDKERIVEKAIFIASLLMCLTTTRVLVENRVRGDFIQSVDKQEVGRPESLKCCWVSTLCD